MPVPKLMPQKLKKAYSCAETRALKYLHNITWLIM